MTEAGAKTSRSIRTRTNGRRLRAIGAACATLAGGAADSQPAPAAGESWFLEAIRAPADIEPARDIGPVIVAIVDDGMRITHRDLAPFLFRNSLEIPVNGIDDDGNGYVDDVHGWDVSDHDGDVGSPAFRDDLGHGTHLAGIVAQLARRAFGERAPELVRILPVKSLPDRAPTTLLLDAYRGLDYAIDAGADIVIAAWSVAQISRDESAVLDEAADRGILIVASAGNFPEDREQFPAAHPSVLAVTAIDRNGEKLVNANYGQFVGLSAPGENIVSAASTTDDAYVSRDGTSFAAALVAAAAALVKSRHPTFSPEEIEACLKSASVPMAPPTRDTSAKLGAGALNVSAAVDCSIHAEATAATNISSRPQGFLRGLGRSAGRWSWQLEPPGVFAGIRFTPVFNREQRATGTLEFRNGPPPDGEVVARYALEAMPNTVYVPGTTAHVEFEPARGRRPFDWLIEYETQAIDFSRLHCRGLVEIDTEGTLTDGSGAESYSPRSDCRWLITAPPGKVVHFRFDALDTEPRTDMIYFFNGSTTRQEEAMAIFSGRELPPELTTWGNQVLVWFVANDDNEGNGWRAEVSFRDP